MSSNTLAGLPFALVCLGILVYCVALLVGTLGSMDHGSPEAHQSDEEAR